MGEECARIARVEFRVWGEAEIQEIRNGGQPNIYAATQLLNNNWSSWVSAKNEES